MCNVIIMVDIFGGAAYTRGIRGKRGPPRKSGSTLRIESFAGTKFRRDKLSRTPMVKIKFCRYKLSRTSQILVKFSYFDAIFSDVSYNISRTPLKVRFRGYKLSRTP